MGIQFFYVFFRLYPLGGESGPLPIPRQRPGVIRRDDVRMPHLVAVGASQLEIVFAVHRKIVVCQRDRRLPVS